MKSEKQPPDYRDSPRFLLSDEEFKKNMPDFPESFGGFELERAVADCIIAIVKQKEPISTEDLYTELDWIDKENNKRIPRYTKVFFDYMLRKIGRDMLDYIHTWNYNATVDNQNKWIISKTWQRLIEDPKSQL